MRKTESASFVPTLIGMTIVLSLALFFRFAHLGEQLPFVTDQARAMLAGRNIALGHWIWRGPATSVAGIELGPWYYYLTAIALKFSHFHPIGPFWMVAAIGTLTTGVLYAFVARYWNLQTALVSAMLYALSPLVIAQSRLALEPSPLPLITVLWMWASTEWARRRHILALFLAIGLPLLGVQFNFSAVLLWPAFALIWLSQTDVIPRSRQQALLLAGGLIWLGLLIGKFIWSDFTSLDYWWRVMHHYFVPSSTLASMLLTILAGSWLVAQLLRWWERWRLGVPAEPPTAVLLSLLLVGIVGFSLKTVGADHALGLLFPIPALALGLSIQTLWHRSRWPIFFVGGIVFFTLMSMSSWRTLQAPPAGTIRDHLPVVDAIMAGAPWPYATVYRGYLDVYDSADDHYQYLLWYLGYPPVEAGRVALTPETREQWLSPQLPRLCAVNRVYIYSSDDELARYLPVIPSGGRWQRVGNVILHFVSADLPR